MTHETTPIPLRFGKTSAAPKVKAAAGANVSRRAGAFEMPIVTLIAAAVLFWAWSRRGEGDWTAETGFGYALGIVGGLMMLMLLIYPMRKRIKALSFLGDIPNWFRIHMLLGVLGPFLVLLHSNFSLGSLNSTAAMVSMLVVAGSGFIGRFLYSRIHRGLFGQKQNVRDLLAEVEDAKARLIGAGCDADLTRGHEIGKALNQYQAQRSAASGAQFWPSLFRTLSGPMSQARLRREVLLLLHKDGGADQFNKSQQDYRVFETSLDKYLYALGRADALAFYERSFAAWHLLHLPLFIILVLAGIAHVVAVHLY